MVLSKKLYELWGPLVREAQQPRCTQDTTWELRANLSMPIYGDARITCGYRAHGGNLYNINLGWDYMGYLQRELFWDSTYAYQIASTQQGLRDIERTLSEPQLSDWSPEQLNDLRDKLYTRLNNFSLRHQWWSSSWFTRLRRFINYRNKVSPEYKNWALLRLLPLRLFSWLKWRKCEK